MDNTETVMKTETNGRGADIEHYVEKYQGHKLTVATGPSLNNQLYLIGVEVANILRRETYNVYRSLKMKKVALKRALPEQIEYLTKEKIVAIGTHSVTFVPYNDGLEFISQVKGKKRKAPKRQLRESGASSRSEDEEIVEDEDSDDYYVYPASPTSNVVSAKFSKPRARRNMKPFPMRGFSSAPPSPTASNQSLACSSLRESLGTSSLREQIVAVSTSRMLKSSKPNRRKPHGVVKSISKSELLHPEASDRASFLLQLLEFAAEEQDLAEQQQYADLLDADGNTSHDGSSIDFQSLPATPTTLAVGESGTF